MTFYVEQRFIRDELGNLITNLGDQGFYRTKQKLQPLANWQFSVIKGMTVRPLIFQLPNFGYHIFC